ncbi:Thoeris anti-phage system NAD(+) hydrolase ThsA [Bacillus cereus]|uniref:Thoeris anti-phage system NAD(+) hydrolase ThsA n=1 Tax=Bacillus cereus TaxID=1396 RepID=UPI003BF637C0
MKMNPIVELFIKDFTKEVMEENAAIFAGAGLSMSVGYVSWAKLLEPIAQEIGLDVNKENDLVSLAQYYCNENQGNRGRINQIILDEFSRKVDLTENHKILARLPIHTYWTTNYDRLIEKALEEENKIADVKYTVKQLATTKVKRDAVVYKMHGDVEHPSKAVLIKDDYEKYSIKMDPYIKALSGDLVSKTFLFVGFSFTDPNLDYILSRVRSAYERDQRRHYCLIKKEERRPDELEADFEYRVRKQELFISDLSRFNIKTIVLNNYNEITEILQRIENNIKTKTVFLSGSAVEYNHWETEHAEQFIHQLSKELIRKDFNIVSGFGLGVGSFVINGVLEELYMNQGTIDDDRLILRPFPQGKKGEEQWDKYRRDMITRTGVSIFLYGNKIDKGQVVKAKGVQSEFNISFEQNNYVVPVGATGYIAKDLWNKVNEEFETYYPGADARMKKLFGELNNEALSIEELINTIIEFVEILSN